jgi:hypothetical protein
MLGIDSDAPGFKKIKITPHLGTMTNAGGQIPHPDGKVAVAYVLDNNKWKINISLPKNTTGALVWAGKSYVLRGGDNSFVLWVFDFIISDPLLYFTRLLNHSTL